MTHEFFLQPCDRIIISLCSLYDKYGYYRYKMNKFEEYDLYAYHKDFLISDGVITFTDTNGKLMALKPDVTLSIVKNTMDEPERVQKLYYNESVYRVSKSSRTFKEITQVGLECLGNVDDYCIYEVLKLAAQSLQIISPDSLIDISHLGLLSDAVDSIGVPPDEKESVLQLIGEKNLHELSERCRFLGIPDEKIRKLKQFAAIHGTPDDVLPKLKELIGGMVNSKTLAQFERIISALNTGKIKKHIRIDFSVVDDFRYYNGIVFKGFVKGIPTRVLSGGRYDALMRKMKKKSSAIGFAVYPDTLEQFVRTHEEYDVDTVLLYDASTPLTDIGKQAETLVKDGSSVSVQKQIPAGTKYKHLMKMQNGEVKIIENNA